MKKTHLTCERILNFWRRITHYCVVKDLNMLNILLCMKCRGIAFQYFLVILDMLSLLEVSVYMTILKLSQQFVKLDLNVDFF